MSVGNSRDKKKKDNTIIQKVSIFNTNMSPKSIDECQNLDSLKKSGDTWL